MGFIEGFLIGSVITGGVMYFVGSNNPYPAAKQRLINKIKNIVPLVLAILFFGSCQKYDNTIKFREASQSPIGYDTTHLVNGNPTPIYDSLYTVSPTWSQAWTWSDQRGELWMFWVGLLVLIVGIGFAIWRYNSGDDKVVYLVSIFAGIIVGGALMGSAMNWTKWNSDKEIPKSQYQNLIQKDGNLHEFWDTISIK